MKPDARTAAVKALCRQEQDGGYSHILLEQMLSHGAWSDADAALITRLLYGVLEHRMTLDFLLAPYCRKPLDKLDLPVRNVLRAAMYQLYYMDRIPPAAVVYQAAEQCRALGKTSAAGFVNGVLRAVLRAGIRWPQVWPEGPAGLAVRYSCPEEWITVWQRQYGEQATEQYLLSLEQPAPAVLRLNTLVPEARQLPDRLAQAGVPFTRHPQLQDCLVLPPEAGIKELAKIPQNWYYYQDTASQWDCAALDAQPGDRVADVCAAPGGKALTLAGRMQGRGHIVACDLYEHKCRLLRQRAARYGADCIETVCRDACTPAPEAWRQAFDRVLCDVPCSGTGVIRRKPEIRYKKPAEFAGLPETQLQILLQAAEMVRPGGVLQYSTCTLHPPENEQVVDRFLALRPDFVPRLLPIAPCFTAAGLPPADRITLFPHLHGTDGFFIAGFTKERSV
ncbi:MAG: 16S rRNA (cytosine(967)-C(5))-methyltransferase RsmB [Clostridia bacterium]|nr:16S rRNA (cytosine(967)-C(5))-methyltransferase RsmB [Clostridia bacterium]